MRNKKHIMYTHSMCRFYVKSSDSAVAHGASQCLCHHRGPRGKAKREERNEWVRSKEIGDNSFHCSSKRGFSYDVCNILTGNQCCHTWDFIPRSWEFSSVMGFFLGSFFWQKSWDLRKNRPKLFLTGLLSLFQEEYRKPG